MTKSTLSRFCPSAYWSRRLFHPFAWVSVLGLLWLGPPVAAQENNSPAVDPPSRYPVRVRKSHPSASSSGSAAPTQALSTSVRKSGSFKPVEPQVLQSSFEAAIGLIVRVESSSGRRYRARDIQNAVRSRRISCDPKTGSLPGEDNALAVTHEGRIRLHPVLFDLQIPERFAEASELEKLEKATTLASVLVHEWSHVLDPKMPQNFEIARYELERQFLRDLLEQERSLCATGQSTQKRVDVIYKVAQEREDQGYNQGDYGGNLSGPRWFP